MRISSWWRPSRKSRNRIPRRKSVETLSDWQRAGPEAMGLASIWITELLARVSPIYGAKVVDGIHSTEFAPALCAPGRANSQMLRSRRILSGSWDIQFSRSTASAPSAILTAPLQDWNDLKCLQLEQQVGFATEKNHRKNHPSMLDTDNLYSIKYCNREGKRKTMETCHSGAVTKSNTAAIFFGSDLPYQGCPSSLALSRLWWRPRDAGATPLLRKDDAPASDSRHAQQNLQSDEKSAFCGKCSALWVNK